MRRSSERYQPAKVISQGRTVRDTARARRAARAGCTSRLPIAGLRAGADRRYERDAHREPEPGWSCNSDRPETQNGRPRSRRMPATYIRDRQMMTYNATSPSPEGL